jgi:hypothetical protein
MSLTAGKIRYGTEIFYQIIHSFPVENFSWTAETPNVKVKLPPAKGLDKHPGD